MTRNTFALAGLLIALAGCGGSDTFDARDRRSGEGATTGLTWIGTLGGGMSQAYGVSSNGTVVVGWAADAASQYRAFRWTTTTMQDLGDFGYRFAEAYGVS
ncbi:MAG: hypothetical protein ACJ79V_24900, partial [Myxococcales bacterium]